ncbi:MAG: prolipoprotein diacylglyceryl transferase [Anaerolineae bacterium]|nr:prolipoprotein diacylglyceryl transferase [Anaerolineae bacterium]
MIYFALMQIGPWWVQPYTLRVTLGVALGMALLWRRGTRPGSDIPTQELLAWVWVIGFAAWACGRLGYVIGQPYFAQQPWGILRFRTAAGLHGSSALAGGVLMVAVWAGIKSRRFSDLLALWTPTALGIAMCAWWGCREVGCAWGNPATANSFWRSWLGVSAPDLYHIRLVRYPVQTLGAAWALVLLLLALGLKEKGGLALALYCVGSAMLTLQRGDPVPLFNEVRVDMLLDITLAAMIAGGTLFPVSLRTKDNHGSTNH